MRVNFSILYFIPSFSGGGAENQLVRLSKELTSRGGVVHIAYLHDGPNLKLAEQSGVKLHKINSLSNYNPFIIFALYRLIRKINPDLIQTWLLHSDICGGIAAGLCSVPWILSERSSGLMYKNSFKFNLRRLMGMRANAIIANSQGGLDYWIRAGYLGKSKLIRNILSEELLQAKSSEIDSAEKPVIIAIGRFSEEKNWLQTLDSLELVAEKISALQIIFLGDGPMRPQLESRISSSPLLKDIISLPGFVDDVSEWLRRATVFISLSSFEGSPNAVIEAISVGCPLVLSDIPSHHELLLHDEARFVSPFDIHDVAKAIIATLQNVTTSRRGVDKAKSRIFNWTPKNIASEYLSAYNDILEGE